MALTQSLGQNDRRVVKGSVMPMAARIEPNIPRRPNAISRAMPATEGGHNRQVDEQLDALCP
jgi:hypothetical protein